MNNAVEDGETYDVREVVARFDDANSFEDAVAAVEHAGIDRYAINMVASHDAVAEKLHQHYKLVAEPDGAVSSPQAIYADKHDIRTAMAVAVGLPVYIGGAAAGLAVVATGSALALGAAAGAVVGAGVGTIFAKIISKHHAGFLEEQLSIGSLLLLVGVRDDEEEKRIIALLKNSHGKDITAHTIKRDWGADHDALPDRDPESFSANFRK